MKHLLLIPCLLLIAAAPLLSCSDDDEKENELPQNQEQNAYEKEETVVDMIPKKNPIKLTDAQKSYVNAVNDFSFKLFKETYDKKKSQVLSPLSVSFVLGMLNDGAEGETAQQIMDAMGFKDADKTAVNEFCANLIENAPKVDPNVKLNIANAIFVNAAENVQLKSGFAQDMQNYYKAAAQSLDFSSPSAVGTINKWCADQTENTITKILDKTKPDELLYLLNAIYFKATWTDRFNPKHTKEETFTKENGTQITKPMMFRNAMILWTHLKNFSCVCLPYSSGAFQMFLMLPDRDVTVSQMLSNLDTETFKMIKADMYPYSITVKIPRFTTSADINLIDHLKNMGITKAFTTEAEFPNITDKNLFVNLFKQAAKIEVNEEGTKVAAVTVAGGYDSANEPPSDFIADRPFAYLIQESTSGTILFMGSYMGD